MSESGKDGGETGEGRGSYGDFQFGGGVKGNLFYVGQLDVRKLRISYNS